MVFKAFNFLEARRKNPSMKDEFVQMKSENYKVL